MSEVVPGGSSLRRLQVEVEAEIEEATASQDPAGFVDPEVSDLETRLETLRSAVVAMETFEEGAEPT